jgi:hypothetical protein
MGHTATVLSSGKVMVAGGRSNGSVLSSGEVYDPGTGVWASTTGGMSSSRWMHTATMLPNGKVLIIGGSPNVAGSSALSQSELYDPHNNRWTTNTVNLAARYAHTATFLSNGGILVTGGNSGSSTSLSSGEGTLYTEYLYYFASTLQPVISTVNGSGSFPVTIADGSSPTIGGSLLAGPYEGSSGNIQASAGNMPRVYLQQLDSGNTTAQQSLRFADATSSLYTYPISLSNLQMNLPSGLSCGYYNMWVQTNSVPSEFKTVCISGGGCTCLPTTCGNLTSTGTGLWSNPGSWSPNQVPSSCNSVTIQAGHVITQDTASAYVNSLTVNGTLMASRTQNNALVLFGGSLNVNSGGMVNYGTTASPIPGGITAQLSVTRGATGQKINIQQTAPAGQLKAYGGQIRLL